MTAASWTSLCLLAALWACERRQASQTTPSAIPDAPWRAQGVGSAFVENLGQWPGAVRFRATIGGACVWLERDALTLQMRALATRESAVRFAFVASDARAAPTGEEPRSASYSYFLGADRSRWTSGARGFACVRYRQLRTGIDVLVCERKGRLEYDLLLAPRSRIDALEVRVEGGTALEITRAGDLLIRTPIGEILQHPPRTWQVARTGERLPRTCRYVIKDPCSFGFELEHADAELATVIDPQLVWSTYLGGSAYEFGYACVQDPLGGVVATGETASNDFPVTPGAYDTTYNGSGAPSPDVYVTRFDPTGKLVYSTYLGGSSGDKPYALAVDASGIATVVGNSASTNFPTTPGAFATQQSGRSDGFVSRLAADGKSLVYSTYLGGNDGDVAQGVSVDISGRATIVGVTSSNDFPTTPGTYGKPPSGTSDVFVTRLSATGASLVYSTRFGGNGGDVAQAVALDADGSAVVAGVMSSTDFPTTPGAFQAVARGSSDAFVLRLNPTASALSFSTLLGGGSGDVAESVCVEGSGAVILAGVTSSSDFPTTPGAFQRIANGASDAFVTKLDATGTRLLFSTLAGGSKGDVGKDVTLDRTGALVLGGQTSSSDFPTTAGAFQTTLKGTADGFLLRLSPDGAQLLDSTYVGGSGSDGGEGSSSDGTSSATLTGVAGSNDFPVSAGAIQPQLAGTNDSFVTRLAYSACGGFALGSSTPACSGSIALGAGRCARSGDPLFAWIGTNAPPSASGVFVLGVASLPLGLPIVGITLYVDPSAPLVTVGVASSNDGSTRLPVSLATAPSGARIFSQIVWLNPQGCQGGGPLSASNALDLTIL